MNQNPHWKQLIRNWAAIIFGNALYSLAVALFLEPAGLITGGATGIALAIGRLTGLSVSGLLLFINLAMLVWGWVVLGRAFALNTLASSVLSPAFLALFEGMANGRVLTEDIFLCTVFAGLGIGVALGIVIRSGASTGGLDIPPLVLNKWFKLPVSATMLAFDIIVLLMQAVFSPMPQVLYGIVMVLIHTIVMDKMLMMGASRTEVKIISSQSDAICAAILEQLDRGVTILHGEGGYTHESSAVLLSIVSNRELPRLEKLAHSIDPTCFLIAAGASRWIRIICKTKGNAVRHSPLFYSNGAITFSKIPARWSSTLPSQMLSRVGSTSRQNSSVFWKSFSMAGMQAVSFIQTAFSKWW